MSQALNTVIYNKEFIDDRTIKLREVEVEKSKISKNETYHYNFIPITDGSRLFSSEVIEVITKSFGLPATPYTTRLVYKHKVFVKVLVFSQVRS